MAAHISTNLDYTLKRLDMDHREIAQPYATGQKGEVQWNPSSPSF